MKWLKGFYDLFVDDPKLAVLALVALAIGMGVVQAGAKEVGGLAIYAVVSGALWYSTRY